ncbi:MAG TPA: hypothetical protein VIM11_25480 [Tepidisphaeraceae bacterium]|jgi:hypothetical protein
MSNVDDLDNLIADNVRDFELGELRRRKLSAAEREQMLTETLGPKSQPSNGEGFALGDGSVGVTPKSVWFEFRRIHFATIVNIAVGEQHEGDRFKYWVDINCTAHRSYRIGVPTILEADNFLVVLSQFLAFKIVPTVEENLREQRQAEEIVASNEANVERRQRRMEFLAIRQQRLLSALIQIECAPRVSFGVIY